MVSELSAGGAAKREDGHDGDGDAGEERDGREPSETFTPRVFLTGCCARNGSRRHLDSRRERSRRTQASRASKRVFSVSAVAIRLGERGSPRRWMPAASSARRMRIHGPDLEKTTFVRFFVAARVLLAAARAAERKIQISQPAPSRTALRVARHPANPSRSRVASLHAPPTPPLDAGRGAQEVLRGASRKVFRPNPTGAPSAVSARFHLLPRRGPAARVDQPTHRPPSYAQARDAYFACERQRRATHRRALRKAYESLPRAG